MFIVQNRPNTHSGQTSIKTQKGVGLIEIMVAVMLLSIGFLAAAQMQIQGMRFSQSAYLQSQAYFMISDMMDRMRGNIAGVKAGAYGNKSTASDAVDPGCNDNYCDETSLAKQDLFEWSANLHNLRQTDQFNPLLPGTATDPAVAQIITRANGVYSVRVTWNEKIGNSDTEESLELDFVPWL